jgi:hypothetical protein
MQTCSPIYNTIFHSKSDFTDPDMFCSKPSELARPSTKSSPDFTVIEDQPRSSKKSLTSRLRHVVQRFIMIFLYPAQSNFLKKFFKQLNPKQLNKVRPRLQNVMNNMWIREITIERNGVRYDGLLIGSPKTLQNGRWILQATGNGCPIEMMADLFGQEYLSADFNVLMINGPSVGRSGGRADVRTIGEAQEAGLRFLETTVNAEQIGIAGHSLGASAIGEAILLHNFRDDISYLVIRQYAFDKTSNVVKKIMGLPILKQFSKYLVLKADLEMDNILSSRKLEELGIPEVIIQAVDPKKADPKSPLTTKAFISDGIIPAKASLGYRLMKEKVLQNKHFIGVRNGNHNGDEFFVLTRKVLSEYFPNNQHSGA